MEKIYNSLQRKIYSYCDNKKGDKILLPVFVNLWDEFEGKIDKRELYICTCKIINGLISRNVLKEVSESNGFDTIYPKYEILPHKDLVKHSFVKEKVFD